MPDEIYAPLSLNQFTQKPLQGQTAYGYVPQKIAGIINPESTDFEKLVPGSPLKLIAIAGQGTVYVDLAGETDQVFGFLMLLTNRNKYVPGAPVDIAYSTNFMYMTADEDLDAGQPVQMIIDDTTGSPAVSPANGLGTTIGINMQNTIGGELAIIFITSPTFSSPIALERQFGIEDIIYRSAGTWAAVRVAAGNYLIRKAAAAETAIVAFDITEAISTQVNKGLKLNSIDVLYGIGTANLVAHSAALYKVSYVDAVAVSSTLVGTTGTLNTVVAANPYVTEIDAASPVVDNTANSKYVLEITANAAVTSVYDLYGITANFVRND